MHTRQKMLMPKSNTAILILTLLLFSHNQQLPVMAGFSIETGIFSAEKYKEYGKYDII